MNLLYNLIKDYPENEVGGSIYNGQLVNVVVGDKNVVYYDQETYPVTFHTHPPDDKILYSFYSTGDIREMMGHAARDKRKRTFYLVTEDGIYSLQFTDEIISLVRTSYDFLEMVLFYFESHIYPLMNPYVVLTDQGLSHFTKLNKKCLGDSFRGNITKMLDINHVTGKEIVDYLLSSPHKSAWFVGALERSGIQMSKCPKIFSISFSKKRNF